jgi:exodeoxyribonuclease-3
MKIVTWNANMAVRRKFTALRALDPDIAIVPECEREIPLNEGVSFAWIGRINHKGLGVFGFGDYSITLDPSYDKRLQWVAPIQVRGPSQFLLLAMWSYAHRATEFHPLEPTSSQPQQALTVYRSLYADQALVAAGDFNNNLQWDRPGKPGNWEVTVERLAEAGLVSAYHDHRKEPFGSEREPTLYWRDRKIDGHTYHIDFCFVPTTWQVDAVEIGSFADWVGAGLSDHVPVIVDVTPSNG